MKPVAREIADNLRYRVRKRVEKHTDHSVLWCLRWRLEECVEGGVWVRVGWLVRETLQQ